MHEWMSDNALTPHVVVDASVAGVEVPRQFVNDGKIVLNVSLSATHGLALGNEGLSFNARFGGQPHHVHVPMTAVLGIYARETGEGMLFTEEDGGPEPPEAGPPDDGARPGGEDRRPRLKVVK